jgi:hypothetical protein
VQLLRPQAFKNSHFSIFSYIKKLYSNVDVTERIIETDKLKIKDLILMKIFNYKMVLERKNQFWWT